MRKSTVKKLAEKARAILDELLDELDELQCNIEDRSEGWQESEAGEMAADNLDELDTAISDLELGVDELEEWWTDGYR